MRTERKWMHIDRTNQVPMPGELAGAADPISALGLMFVPTYRTAARCASFGAGEAHDVSSFAFVSEVVDVLAIFPQSHTLIVVATIVPIAYAMRIANEEAPHFVLNTKVNDLSCCLMPQITDTPFSPTALLVLGSLQFLPTTGILGTTGLLLGDLTQTHSALPLETTDTTSSDDLSLTCIRGYSRQMDFTEIHGSMSLTWSLLCLRNFHAHMQLKAIIPDERTCTTIFREVNG